MSPLRWGVGGAAGALSGLIWLLAVGVLHELAVDGPGSFELFKGAAELFLGLEESLFEFCVASGQLLIGEFGEHAFGQEVVGDKPGAFGLGEPVLQGAELLLEPVALGPAVFQFGS